MNTVDTFVVGERYTNDQIGYTLNLENLGGIRPSIGADGFAQHLALMTATETSGKRKSDNPYHDRIEGDILVYTGTGRVGDQVLSGKNRRLTEQYERPTPFYGFINEGRQIYQFLGLLELLRHYPEQQLDTTGQIRTAWVFEFRIHRRIETVPVAMAATISAQLLSESRRNHPTAPEEREVVTHIWVDTEAPALIQTEELRTASGG